MTALGHWIWSHDIQATQLADLAWPGWGPVRLAAYGDDRDYRRFAAILYQGHGIGRTCLLDLDPAGIGERLARSGLRPVSLTARSMTWPRLSVLVESGSAEGWRLEAGLGEDQLRELLRGPAGVADLATYVVSGTRQYAVILDQREPPSLLITGVEARQLKRELRRADAAVTRLRAYTEGERLLLAAVATRGRTGFSDWGAGLDASGVGRRLERRRAYPADLDAIWTEDGVRYTVVMRR